MKIVGFIFYLLAVALAITSLVYTFILGWNCFERLFEVGGTWEVAKHAFIVTFSCGLSAKVACGIGSALFKYKE